MGQVIPIILRNPEGLMCLSRFSAGLALVDAWVQGHKAFQVWLVPKVGIVKAGVQHDRLDSA